MDILLYKDGHLSISESPLQGKENNLDDVVMLVSNPQEGDTLTYKGGKWVNGEGGGGGGGAMVLTMTMTETKATFGATYAEVKAAMMSGRDVVYVMNSGTTHMLFKLIMCIDATDPAQGGQYEASFYNPLQDNPERLYADTEDGELYISFGG